MNSIFEIANPKYYKTKGRLPKCYKLSVKTNLLYQLKYAAIIWVGDIIFVDMQSTSWIKKIRLVFKDIIY